MIYAYGLQSFGKWEEYVAKQSSLGIDITMLGTSLRLNHRQTGVVDLAKLMLPTLNTKLEFVVKATNVKVVKGMGNARTLDFDLPVSRRIKHHLNNLTYPSKF